MGKLTFEQFSRANEARKKQFFKGASTDNWSISDAYMAAAGEMGEIAEPLIYMAAMRHLGEAGNALKKVKRAELGMLNQNATDRQIDSLNDAKAKVAGEIGGFMCYLDQLCVQIGLRLEDCIVDEFNTKSAELKLPERIIEGQYVIAEPGTFMVNGKTFKGEVYRMPEDNETVVTFKIDDMGDLNVAEALGMDAAKVSADIRAANYDIYAGVADEAAARVHLSKYREAWPETSDAYKRAAAMGGPYGEQPFNERGLSVAYHIGPCALTKPCPSPEVCIREKRCYASGPEMPEERRRVIPDVSPIDPYVVQSAMSDLEAARQAAKPDRPTVWTDGCGKCRWCAMDMEMDPYCTNPEVKKVVGATVGIGLNTALQTCVTVDGKLNLFEPRES